MSRVRALAAVAMGGAFLAIAACNTGPSLPPPLPPQAFAPPVPAYVYEDLIGGRDARVRKAVAAGAKRLAPGEVPSFVNRQEIELRRQTAGTGIDVFRAGEVLLVRLPANVTFAVGQSNLGPQGQSLVGEIARTLKSYKQSLVDVLGHTDATGNAAANVALSQRRAQSVSTYLSGHGVNRVRIAAKGYGASHAIGDNATETGRAENRRVEIKIVPLR